MNQILLLLTTEKEVVQALADGDKGTIIVEQTPFYATMGGQIGDKGIIKTDEWRHLKLLIQLSFSGTMVGHVGYVSRRYDSGWR